MKNKATFTFRNKLKSFAYAFNGLKVFFATEQNSIIHSVATVLAVLLSYLLNVSTTEWLIVILIIGGVFVAEIFNSSIEHLADAVTEEKNEKIKIVKDLAAAAVLLLSIVAVIIALIIFVPKILAIVN